MTTSGTSAWDLDFAEIAEEAYERCGSEMRTGYDLRTARRSLNLMLSEWSNMGVNLWTIEEGAIPLVAGVGQYDLPSDTVDLLEHVIRTGAGNAATQADITISRISVSSWASIPVKLATGRPIQIFIERRTGVSSPLDDFPPRVNVWPVPDASQPYTLVYWRLRRMQDMTTGAVNADVPYRFLPCLIAGLAYHLAMKVPNALDRLGVLKEQYDRAWDLAAGEDREKAPVRFVPRIALR